MLIAVLIFVLYLIFVLILRFILFCVLHKNYEINDFFAWYDCYHGWYYDRKKKIFYICWLPMMLTEIKSKSPPACYVCNTQNEVYTSLGNPICCKCFDQYVKDLKKEWEKVRRIK